MANLAKFQDFTALALALRAVWEEQLVLDSPLAALFNIATSNDAQEITQGLGSTGLVEKFNGSIPFDEPDPGNRRTYVHDQFAKGLQVERALLDDGKYSIVQTMVRQHAEAFRRTVAYEMASVFNNAFSTTVAGRNYAAADTKALCDSTRTSGKQVLANKGTSALTHDNLTATRRLMRSFKDAKGLVILSNPDTLIVPVGLEDTANEIVKSTNRSDTTNNATNTTSNLSVIVDPMLSDTNNWFLVDSRSAKMHLWWWWRNQPEFAADPKSEFDLVYRYRGYMRYSFGPDATSWIYGHQVA